MIVKSREYPFLIAEQLCDEGVAEGFRHKTKNNVYFAVRQSNKSMQTGRQPLSN